MKVELDLSQPQRGYQAVSFAGAEGALAASRLARGARVRQLTAARAADKVAKP